MKWRKKHVFYHFNYNFLFCYWFFFQFFYWSETSQSREIAPTRLFLFTLAFFCFVIFLFLKSFFSKPVKAGRSLPPGYFCYSCIFFVLFYFLSFFIKFFCQISQSRDIAPTRLFLLSLSVTKRKWSETVAYWGLTTQEKYKTFFLFLFSWICLSNFSEKISL